MEHSRTDVEAIRIEATPTEVPEDEFEPGDDAELECDYELRTESLGRFPAKAEALIEIPEMLDLGADSVDIAVAVPKAMLTQVATGFHGDFGGEVEVNGWLGEVGDFWFPTEGYEEAAVWSTDADYPGGDRILYLLQFRDLFVVYDDWHGDRTYLASRGVKDALADFLANHVEEGIGRVESPYRDPDDDWSDDDEED